MATPQRYALSEDQQQLRDSVARFVQDHYGFADWRAALRTPQAMRAPLWQNMAEFGWLAVAVPEQYGGLGLGQRERLIIAEELGRGLVSEPWWSTAVLGAELILGVANEAQKQALLPALCAGELRLACALFEPAARYDWTAVNCRATPTASGWSITGKKIVVLDAALADELLVLVRTHGASDERAGLALLRVPASSKGLRRSDFRAIDERHCADLEFDNVEVPADHLLGTAGAAAEALDRALDIARVTLCAEAIGVMTTALQQTIDYIKTRRQFGRAIAEFQAVQHRIADMTMATEQARSLTQLAGLNLDAGAGARRRFACAAKVQIGQSGRFVGEQGIQLHGGVGVTDEVQVGHCLKRLMALDFLLGDANHHLQRFAAAVLDDPVEPV